VLEDKRGTEYPYLGLETRSLDRALGLKYARSCQV
jgi:hypothetical protein